MDVPGLGDTYHRRSVIAVHSPSCVAQIPFFPCHPTQLDYGIGKRFYSQRVNHVVVVSSAEISLSWAVECYITAGAPSVFAVVEVVRGKYYHLSRMLSGDEFTSMLKELEHVHWVLTAGSVDPVNGYPMLTNGSGFDA